MFWYPAGCLVSCVVTCRNHRCTAIRTTRGVTGHSRKSDDITCHHRTPRDVTHRLLSNRWLHRMGWLYTDILTTSLTLWQQYGKMTFPWLLSLLQGMQGEYKQQTCTERTTERSYTESCRGIEPALLQTRAGIIKTNVCHKRSFWHCLSWLPRLYIMVWKLWR